MSDIFDTLVSLFKGGSSGTTVTSTSTSSTNVTVNPEITSINLIDTAPLADALEAGLLGFNAIQEAGQAAIIDQGAAQAAGLEDRKTNQAESWRLALSVAALGIAVYRRA